MTPYELITKYYSTQPAPSSGVDLMKHIDQGIMLLKALGAYRSTIDAWIIHPIVQDDEAFQSCYKGMAAIDPDAMILAMEYRVTANNFRTQNPILDRPVKNPKYYQVNLMLVADKMQNLNDFKQYHAETHERKEELTLYFARWFEALEIDIEFYTDLVAELKNN